ncbi:GerMN domain-containing protein [Auritidibacter sp. NML100628]|uniref:GerMN domain-containing protein n=1 Tax=Auritidibacter sp. NML100628 TaxID=2170742 RepID=UPI000D72D9A3|nr:GerMN domain-containing protein [Auritidibacter sp. NML100628]PXA78396.1 hypothetical protein DCC24_01570 [Auritidibacter sp. NML100628]
MLLAKRPRGGSLWPRLSAVAVCGALVLTGCSDENSNPESLGPGGTVNVQKPDDDGYTSLPISLVALSGNYPPNTTGNTFGCEDLLVSVQSAPTLVENETDTVKQAVQFLLDDQHYRHGDPPFTNSVVFSRDSLQVEETTIDGDTVTVKLSGEVVTRSDCESQRILAQLKQTAERAAHVSQSKITVNDQPLNEVLGIADIELGEEITTES